MGGEGRSRYWCEDDREVRYEGEAGKPGKVARRGGGISAACMGRILSERGERRGAYTRGVKQGKGERGRGVKRLMKAGCEESDGK